MINSVKSARVKAGLTQQQIAEKLNINRTTYLKYEKHPEQMPSGVAMAMSKIVGVYVDDILFSLKST